MDETLVAVLIIGLIVLLTVILIMVPKLIAKAQNGVRNKVGEHKNEQKVGQVSRLADRYPDLVPRRQPNVSASGSERPANEPLPKKTVDRTAAPAFDRNEPTPVSRQDAAPEEPPQAAAASAIDYYSFPTGRVGVCPLCGRENEELFRLTIIKNGMSNSKDVCRACRQSLEARVNKMKNSE